MRRHHPALSLLLLPLCACGEAQPEALLAPAFTAVAGSCVQYRGEAQPVSVGPKLLQARLTGELTGTLRILPTLRHTTGVVEHEEAVFVLDREEGAVLFGDGMRGRRLPTGPPAQGRSRYEASGAVTGQAAAPGEPLEPARGSLWIGGELAPDPAASSLRYRLGLCADAVGR